MLCPDDHKKLKNAVKREKKRLYDLGWPTDLEIKGSALFGCHHEKRVPRIIADARRDHLKRFITKILKAGASLHYSTVRKAGLLPHLRNAPYGIAYNYFTGNLLCKMYNGRINGPVSYQRSKSLTRHARATGSGLRPARL
jgi:hypothetical protein